MFRKVSLGLAIAAAGLVFAPAAFAFDGTAPEPTPGTIFLWLVIILLLGKLTRFVERYGQPPVLGELVVGVILGNLVLLGVNWFEPIKFDSRINFLAQLGVVILLFQVGLDTNIQEMSKVGARAFLVACVGVITPFFLATWVFGPRLLPGLPTNTYIFLGATLTATSVGITARVFKDLSALRTREAQIVLGAAVIDDVLGLIILAVVTAMVTVGSIDPLTVIAISAKAILFLAGAVMLGALIATPLGRLFSKIHTGIGMKFTLAICFGLLTAFIAEQVGLAPIIGAFAAGLVIDPKHFRYFEEAETVAEIRSSLADASPIVKAHILPILESNATRHIDHLIDPLGHFLVPIFFVLTGMGVRLDVLFNLNILAVALAITAIGVVGKLVAGLAAGNVNKLIVGWGMVPRGEVELIFAATAKSLGVFSDEIFSMIVIVIILSTFLAPPILSFIIKRTQPGSISPARLAMDPSVNSISEG